MECRIREWKMEDEEDLAAALNNKKILDNLRDSLPFPYLLKDARDYIGAMLGSDRDKAYAFAITVDEKVAEALACSGRLIFMQGRENWDIMWRNRTGVRELGRRP